MNFNVGFNPLDILGLKESKANRQSTEDWNRNRVWYTVQDAKRAGISPLAAMGAPIQQGGGNFISGSGGVNVDFKSRKDFTELEKLRIEKDIENSEADIALKQARASLMMRDAMKPNIPTEGVERVISPEITGKKGTEVRTPFGSWTTAANKTTMQAMQDIYGDGADWIIGLPWLAHDLFWAGVYNMDSYRRKHWNMIKVPYDKAAKRHNRRYGKKRIQPRYDRSLYFK